MSLWVNLEGDVAVLRSRILGILLLTLICTAPVLAAQASSAQDEVAQVLARLEAVIPNKPMEVTPEIASLMEKAGSTRRLDAAILLIRALAFNWTVVGSNESMTLFGMLTAGPILQRHYGAAVLPLLMYEGVTTNEEWLQKRIALVVREVGKEKEVTTVRAAFSMKDSVSPAAKRFGELLDTRDLKIELADPSREGFEDLERRIRGIKPPL
jgi:hypothetical protein